MEIIKNNMVYIWVGLATCLILLVPGAASVFSDEVNWKGSDFCVMGLLLFSAGSLIVLSSKTWRGWRLVLSYGLIVLAFLYIWAELAVGIFFSFGS